MSSKNKKMKVLIALLIVTIVAACALISIGFVNKKDDSLKIAVVTDTHVFASSKLTTENYDEYRYSDKMLDLSEAILNTFADNIIEQKVDCLLVCGDLTQYGDEDSHKVVAKCFSRLEQNGIEVYVINGNHDMRRIYSNQFKEIYADFGYNQAKYFCEAEENLSYVSDLDEKHRLIAIDNIDYKTSEDSLFEKKSLSDEHRLWVYDMIEKSIEEGKKPIIITHKPLLTHFPEVIELIDEDEEERAFAELVKFCALNGAEISFVGHEHTTDIKEVIYYNGDNECRFVKAETSNFNFGAPTYRVFSTNGNKFKISSYTMDNLNKKYLPSVTPKDEIEYIENNGLIAYGTYIMTKWFDSVIDEVMQNLNVRLPEKFDYLNDAYDIVKAEVIPKFFNMRFYKKDEDNDVSLERIVEGYGKTLPVTRYSGVRDLAIKYASEYIDGNEKFEENFPELIQYVVYGLIGLINDVAPEINEAIEKNCSTPMPKLAFDMQRLYDTGELECYESNLVPLALIVVEEFLDDSGFGFLSLDFLKKGFGDPGTNKGIHNSALLLPIINSLTKEKFVGFDEYIYDKYIKLGGENSLLIDGVFNKFASDILADTQPDDKEYSSEYISKTN